MVQSLQQTFDQTQADLLSKDSDGKYQKLVVPIAINLYTRNAATEKLQLYQKLLKSYSSKLAMKITVTYHVYAFLCRLQILSKITHTSSTRLVQRASVLRHLTSFPSALCSTDSMENSLHISARPVWSPTMDLTPMWRENESQTTPRTGRTKISDQQVSIFMQAIIKPQSERLIGISQSPLILDI